MLALPTVAAPGELDLLVDGRGTPLALRITGAQRHDSTQLLALLDEGLRARRIEDRLARPRTVDGSGLGNVRNIVERMLCWIGDA